VLSFEAATLILVIMVVVGPHGKRDTYFEIMMLVALVYTHNVFEKEFPIPKLE
jgi:hypothetical protein